MGGRSLSCCSRCCVRPDSIDVTPDVTDVESILVTFESSRLLHSLFFVGDGLTRRDVDFQPEVQSTRRLTRQVDGRLPIRPVTGFRRCDLVMIDPPNVPFIPLFKQPIIALGSQ
jgi:hypothetical protein